MSNKFTGITSAGSAIPVYDKDAHSALSQKLDTTALAPAIEAAVSGKQDAGDYYSATNPSGFISSVPETYLQNSDLTVNEGKITEISGIPLSAGDELPEIVTQAADLVSANSATWDTVTGKQDAGDYYSATNPSGFLVADDITGKMDVTGMTAYQPVGDYQPAGDYYSATNPSGFIDANALTPYQTIEGMSAYQPSGDYQAAGDYYSASNPSGFISSVPDTYLQNTDLTVNDGKITEISGVPLSAGDELPSGVMVESAVGFNAVNEISGYNGSAFAQYGAEKQWLVHDDTLVHAANSAQYALGVNLSAVAQLLGVDETVLWTGSANTTATSGTLSESLENFNMAKIYTVGNSPDRASIITTVEPRFGSLNYTLMYFPNYTIAGGTTTENTMYLQVFSDKTFKFLAGSKWVNGTYTQSITAYDFAMTKIVGIGRKS